MRNTLIAVLIFCSISSHAQCAFQWPDDPARKIIAKIILAEINQSIDNNSVEGTQVKISVLDELIGPSDTVFILQARFDNLKFNLKSEDPLILYANALLNFDSWTSECGSNVRADAWKAYAAFQMGRVLNIEIPAIWMDNYNFSFKVIDKYGIHTPAYLFIPHWINSINCRKSGHLSVEEIGEIYTQLDSLLSRKGEVYPAEKDRLIEIQNMIDSWQLGDEFTCDYVINTLATKFDRNPSPQLAIAIFNFLHKGGCIDNPLYVKVAGYNIDPPNFYLLYNLALKSKGEENVERTIKLLLEALKYAEDDTERRMAEELLAEVRK